MEKRFETLLRSDLYQVFLFTCPAVIPFNFAVHPWFVINKKGDIERFGVGRTAGEQRWEVFWRPEKDKENWGHLHRNSLPPTHGIPMFSFSQKYFWRGTLRGHIEGDEGSVAHKIAEFIEHSPDTYPHCYRYSLKGPNSNTYAQWVLNQFPQSGLTLPWNSFGKNN